MEHSQGKWEFKPREETTVPGCPGWLHIANSWFATFRDGLPKNEVRANIALIVAAPELLEAAKIGLEYVQGSNGCSNSDCSVCKEKLESVAVIEQAIAKAENN